MPDSFRRRSAGLLVGECCNFNWALLLLNSGPPVGRQIDIIGCRVQRLMLSFLQSTHNSLAGDIMTDRVRASMSSAVKQSSFEGRVSDS